MADKEEVRVTTPVTFAPGEGLVLQRREGTPENPTDFRTATSVATVKTPDGQTQVIGVIPRGDDSPPAIINNTNAPIRGELGTIAYTGNPPAGLENVVPGDTIKTNDNGSLTVTHANGTTTTLDKPDDKGTIIFEKDAKGNVVARWEDANAQNTNGAGKGNDGQTAEGILYKINAKGEQVTITDPTPKPTQTQTPPVVTPPADVLVPVTQVKPLKEVDPFSVTTKQSPDVRPTDINPVVQQKDAEGNPVFLKDSSGNLVLDGDRQKIPVYVNSDTALATEYRSNGSVTAQGDKTGKTSPDTIRVQDPKVLAQMTDEEKQRAFLGEANKLLGGVTINNGGVALYAGGATGSPTLKEVQVKDNEGHPVLDEKTKKPITTLQPNSDVRLEMYGIGFAGLGTQTRDDFETTRTGEQKTPGLRNQTTGQFTPTGAASQTWNPATTAQVGSDTNLVPIAGVAGGAEFSIGKPNDGVKPVNFSALVGAHGQIDTQGVAKGLAELKGGVAFKTGDDTYLRVRVGPEVALSNQENAFGQDKKTDFRPIAVSVALAGRQGQKLSEPDLDAQAAALNSTDKVAFAAAAAQEHTKNVATITKIGVEPVLKVLDELAKSDSGGRDFVTAVKKLQDANTLTPEALAKLAETHLGGKLTQAVSEANAKEAAKLAVPSSPTLAPTASTNKTVKTQEQSTGVGL